MFEDHAKFLAARRLGEDSLKSIPRLELTASRILHRKLLPMPVAREQRNNTTHTTDGVSTAGWPRVDSVVLCIFSDLWDDLKPKTGIAD